MNGQSETDDSEIMRYGTFTEDPIQEQAPAK